METGPSKSGSELPLAQFQTIVIELQDGITAIDGQPLEALVVEVHDRAVINPRLRPSARLR